MDALDDCRAATRSFSLIFRSEFHRWQWWLLLPRISVEREKKRKNENAENERNSEPLVSKTRFSRTIRHRMWVDGERRKKTRGNAEKREREKRFGCQRKENTLKVPVGSGNDHGFSTPLRASRIYMTDRFALRDTNVYNSSNVPFARLVYLIRRFARTHLDDNDTNHNNKLLNQTYQ